MAAAKDKWTNLQDSIEWDDVGGRLLANIAKGIYNHEAVLREYVQNACDSYNMMDVVPADPTIVVTAEGNDVAIQDFGIGMDEEHIRSVKKVAVSNKDNLEDVAGFRGIGVWAGLQACEQLVVETTKAGCDKKYRLVIEFAQISNNFDKNINIKKLIDPNYSISWIPAPIDDHYTRTTLRGILTGYTNLLDPAELKRIVSTILPCEINPSWSQAPAVNKILSATPRYKAFTIKVGADVVYRRFPKDDVLAPTMYPIKAADGEELARIWYCPTKDVSLDVKGFQVRVHNFGVGDSNPYSNPQGHSYGLIGGVVLGAVPRLNWFYGEVHVISPKITPNTPRNDLEINPHTRELIEGLRTFYSQRIAEAEARSSFNGILKTLAVSEKELLKMSAIKAGSYEAKRVEDAIKELEKAVSKTKGTTKVEKDIVFRDLLNQPTVLARRKNVLTQLKKIRPEPEKPKTTPAATKKTTGANGTKKPATGPKEELISGIISILEARLGSDHEEFTPLCSEIEELVTSWNFADA